MTPPNKSPESNPVGAVRAERSFRTDTNVTETGVKKLKSPLLVSRNLI
jgi:hypothetical protein